MFFFQICPVLLHPVDCSEILLAIVDITKVFMPKFLSTVVGIYLEDHPGNGKWLITMVGKGSGCSAKYATSVRFLEHQGGSYKLHKLQRRACSLREPLQIILKK